MLIIRLDWTWTEIIWNGIAILVRLGLRQIYCIFFCVLFSLFGGILFFPTLVCKINVFVLAKHRTHIGRWSSLAWNPMHHTTIHKKCIKFKFCWNYFSFFLVLSALVYSLCVTFLSSTRSVVASIGGVVVFPICLLGYMYMYVSFVAVQVAWADRTEEHPIAIDVVRLWERTLFLSIPLNYVLGCQKNFYHWIRA